MVSFRLPTTLVVILAITALASSDDSSPKTHLSPLLKRQSEAFVPDKNNGNGKTCADAFGPGYYSCGTGIECVNPAKGQTCCSGGYGCPRNSFCLIKGYCCPNGLSPESCARANFVTLPADFTTAGVALSNSTSPSTSVSLSAIASTSQSSSASPSTSASASVSVGTSTSSVVAVVPTSAESTSAESPAAVAASTASTSTTQTATTTRPSVEVSTGAARAWRAVGAGEGGFGVWGLAGLVGVLGVVGGIM